MHPLLKLTSLAMLLGILTTPVWAAKPEVVISPGGMTPDILKSVNSALQAVVRIADDQDAGESERIRQKARDAVVTALQVHGYFTPKVNLEVGQDIGGETWEVSVDSGPVTKVTSVDNSFKGAISSYPRFASRIAQLRQDWGLPVGHRFENSLWGDAKVNILEEVGSRDFYLARMTESQALIDPQQQSAHLSTTIDSGPAVTLGNLKISGLHRVPESLVKRYIRYQEGAPFSQAQLNEWQQQLMSTNFFRGAFITLEKPPGDKIYAKQTAQLPVKVSVTEGPARSLTGVLGADDASGIRAEALYKQYIVGRWPVTLETGAAADFNEQRAFFDIYFPPNKDATQDSVGVLARHSDIENEDVRRLAFGWKRKHSFKWDSLSRVDFESNWGVIANYDQIKRLGEPRFKLPTVVASWDGLRRDVNDMYDPRSGNLEAIGLAVGTSVNQRRWFARAGLRVQFWFPIGRRDVVTTRFQVGQVFAAKDTLIPDDFGYRTGGPRSLRGYRFNEFGHHAGRAVVGARSLAVASLQYMHYFDDRLGMSVFVDAGDAAPSFKQMKVALGYGAGALIKTPAGPLELNLAYGQRDHKIRLHFSLGVAF